MPKIERFEDIQAWQKARTDSSEFLIMIVY